MNIASWNVNSLRVRLDHLNRWVQGLQDKQPDIVALQETKTVDESFPLQALTELGFHAVFSGQKTYNGVAILSRTPASEVMMDIPGLSDPQRRVLAATFDHPFGQLRLINLYVPNGSEVGSEKYTYKLNWLTHLRDWLVAEMERFPNLVVLGDFNIAPDDRDVHDPSAWEGKVLCSEPERDALQQLLDLGLKDTFRLFEQEENSFSWWDYRAAGFRRNRGLRIDLILASSALSQRCQASMIDKEPRRWERPSDHAPVIASFSLD